MKHISKHISALSIIAIMVFLPGCFSVRYDLKGGISINPELQTFSVQYFDNRAPRVEPTMSQRFTEALQDYIEANTKLKYVTTYGDIDFSGTITNYEIRAAAISANDVAAKTRFTITVNVNYKNILDPDSDFQQSFTRFRDFDSNEQFNASLESELSDELIEELVELVFNKAFVNW